MNDRLPFLGGMHKEKGPKQEFLKKLLREEAEAATSLLITPELGGRRGSVRE